MNADLGLMLYDVVFRKGGNAALFFRAHLRDGVLLTDPREVLDPAQCEEVLACSSRL
jgi:hypothetical protein